MEMARGSGELGDIGPIDNGRAERLREALAKGGGRIKVAEQIGIHPQSLTRYLAGRDMPTSNLVAIAEACAVSLEWLATGRASQAPHDTTPLIDERSPDATLWSQNVSGSGKSRYVALPRYNIAASAGGGALAEHAQVVEYIAFDVDFVRNRLRRDPKHLVLIEARGDSMEPTIRDGDILTVDVTPGQPLHNAQLYILRVNDNLLVKRLEQRVDGAVIVHSDNTRYSPETIPRAQLATLNIVGEVLLVTTPPR